MKLNYFNRIIKYFTFSALSEAQFFFESQKDNRKLFLFDTFGDNHCIVKSEDSLSGELDFCIGFSSETSPEKLNIIVCVEFDRWIVEVDNFLYFVNSKVNKVLSKSEINTPLIGLHLKGKKNTRIRRNRD